MKKQPKTNIGVIPTQITQNIFQKSPICIKFGLLVEFTVCKKVNIFNIFELGAVVLEIRPFKNWGL